MIETTDYEVVAPARHLQPGDRILTFSGLSGPRIINIEAAPGDRVLIELETREALVLPGAMRVTYDPRERE